MSLLTKTALVTGSTSGIGLAVAKSLAATGCSVVLSGSRSTSLASQALSETKKVPRATVHYLQCDLRRTDNIFQMLTHLDQICPKGVDILVNNAGYIDTTAGENITHEEWNDTIAVNLSAPFLLTKHVFPSMKAKGWGRIINMASTNGLVAGPSNSPYTSSKHGLVGLTKAVARDTAESGITCNAICPFWVDTPIVETFVQKYAEEHKTTIENAKFQKELMADQYPTKRITTPEQIANLVTFLCSPGADNMTGTAIPMDGGMTAT